MLLDTQTNLRLTVPLDQRGRAGVIRVSPNKRPQEGIIRVCNIICHHKGRINN